MDKVKIKCWKCNGTGKAFYHSKYHEEVDCTISCWAAGCREGVCRICGGKGYVEEELFERKS